MNKAIALLLTLTLAASSFAQINVQEKYKQADAFYKAKSFFEAYKIYKEIKPLVNAADSLYKYVSWYYIAAATNLENEYRMKEDFKNSLSFGLEALTLIQENKVYFDKRFADREYWMNKNILVSYFGLGQIDEAKKYKEKLYAGYKEKSLPDGLDGYFNYDYFKLNGMNIWGYEWYPELPDDRFSSSFTKVVYYVYSTNPDGTDKDQLFRFHVLMFHQDNKDAKFDYLLERQIETDDATISGSYYQYTYKKDIDYKKLKADVIEIVTKEIEPGSKRSQPKRK